jgi:23S rRNA pseudouridine1911/1915/1917 synthase
MENASDSPAPAAIDVLYEDDRYIIVNKAIGTSVQDDATGEKSLLAELSTKYGGKIFLTHRIDKPVSGVVALAKSAAAQADLQRLFTDQAVDKRYWAVVDAPPKEPEGTIESWLFFDTKQNKSFIFDSKPEKKASLAKGSKLSSLSYRTVGSSDRYWFLEVKLISGRHHQVRAQLAHIGCRIKGDLKYGAKRSDPGGGIHLHARSISFVDPSTVRQVSAVAAPPRDALWDLFLELAEKNPGK